MTYGTEQSKAEFSIANPQQKKNPLEVKLQLLMLFPKLPE